MSKFQYRLNVSNSEWFTRCYRGVIPGKGKHWNSRLVSKRAVSLHIYVK